MDPVGPCVCAWWVFLVIHSCHSLEALLSGSVKSESGSTREKKKRCFPALSLRHGVLRETLRLQESDMCQVLDL